MDDFLSKPLVRAGIVAGLTYLAYKYAPAGVGKTVALAVGSVAAVGVASQAVPMIGSVLNGYLPVATASA